MPTLKNLFPVLLLLSSWLPAAQAQNTTAQAEIPVVIDPDRPVTDKTLLNEPVRDNYSLLWFVLPVVVIATYGLTRRSRTKGIRSESRPNVGIYNARAYPFEDAPNDGVANPGRTGRFDDGYSKDRRNGDLGHTA